VSNAEFGAAVSPTAVTAAPDPAEAEVPSSIREAVPAVATKSVFDALGDEPAGRKKGAQKLGGGSAAPRPHGVARAPQVEVHTGELRGKFLDSLECKPTTAMASKPAPAAAAKGGKGKGKKSAESTMSEDDLLDMLMGQNQVCVLIGVPICVY
jgi:hypothetical protein